MKGIVMKKPHSHKNAIVISIETDYGKSMRDTNISADASLERWQTMWTHLF